jgi:hypothetical protein
VIQVEAIGKGGVVIILATVIVTLIIAAMAWGDARRAMDRASIAERESRIAMDEIDRLKVRLEIDERH